MYAICTYYTKWDRHTRSLMSLKQIFTLLVMQKMWTYAFWLLLLFWKYGRLTAGEAEVFLHRMLGCFSGAFMQWAVTGVPHSDALGIGSQLHGSFRTRSTEHASTFLIFMLRGVAVRLEEKINQFRQCYASIIREKGFYIQSTRMQVGLVKNLLNKVTNIKHLNMKYNILLQRYLTLSPEVLWYTQCSLGQCA